MPIVPTVSTERLRFKPAFSRCHLQVTFVLVYRRLLPTSSGWTQRWARFFRWGGGGGVATSGWAGGGGGGIYPPNSQKVRLRRAKKKKRSPVSPKIFLLRGKNCHTPPNQFWPEVWRSLGSLHNSFFNSWKQRWEVQEVQNLPHSAWVKTGAAS